MEQAWLQYYVDHGPRCSDGLIISLVSGISPLIEQGQTNIELISGQEQILEVPTDQFDVVSATFSKSS